MFNLSYSGDVQTESNHDQKAHDLLDALLATHNSDSPISVDVGQVRPGDDFHRVIVSLSAESDMSTLQSVETTLADELVALGVEPDGETAKEQIQINN
jgi:hypothetical protein